MGPEGVARVKKSGSKRSTKSSRYWDIKTFTWFISTPAKSGPGHREKEFDKIMHGILNSGHEIIEWRLESAGGERGGVLAVFLLGSTEKKMMGPALDLHEKFGLEATHSDPSIEFFNEDD